MMAIVTPHVERPWTRRIRLGLGVLALLFGLATLKEGGLMLFGGAEAREAAGAIVPFVLLFNFSAGFVYLATGVGALAGKSWALLLARGLALSTLLVFAAFGIHIALGGAFMTHTAVAMTLRSVFWVVQALILARVMP